MDVASVIPGEILAFLLVFPDYPGSCMQMDGWTPV